MTTDEGRKVDQDVAEDEEDDEEEEIVRKPKKRKVAKKRGKVAQFFHDHKRELIAGGIGLGAGIGGTIGVGELAKRRAEKRQAAYLSQQDPEVSPLDPNVM